MSNVSWWDGPPCWKMTMHDLARFLWLFSNSSQRARLSHRADNVSPQVPRAPIWTALRRLILRESVMCDPLQQAANSDERRKAKRRRLNGTTLARAPRKVNIHRTDDHRDTCNNMARVANLWGIGKQIERRSEPCGGGTTRAGEHC